MNRNSNIYIVIYSTVMVVIVALALAFASGALRDRQRANEENEMKLAILRSVGRGDIPRGISRAQFIREQYEKYITGSFVVDTKGDVLEGINAFELLGDLRNEFNRPFAERRLPVFVSAAEDGTEIYILSVRGAGLWGPLWGYVALESDWNTIYGVSFDHQGETPGLGAEITVPAFTNQFRGKRIFDDGQLVSVTVLKGSGSSAGNIHAVDAISGGTITSRGVQNMLLNSLENYRAFIEKQRNSAAATEAETHADGEENDNVKTDGNE